MPQDYAAISLAIDAAVDGDTIQVGPGTYHEALETHSKDITIESVAGPMSTIIEPTVFPNKPMIHIFGSPGERPVIRGFTIRGGYVRGQGGGVLAGGTAVVEGNRILNNAACSGSGVFVSGTVTLRDNLISGNSDADCASNYGIGAVMVAANSTATIVDNTIVDNIRGGGIRVGANAAPTIARNIVSRNIPGPWQPTTIEAGGITMTASGVVQIENNRITGNEGTQVAWDGATTAPGPRLVNNTIVAPKGALALDIGAHAVITNNVIVGDHPDRIVLCESAPTGGLPAFDRNDVYNLGRASYVGCGSPDGSAGNVAVDPRFVDPLSPDYHLRPDSPLIDAGGASGAPADDFDGDIRPFDGDEDGTALVDIGFDESTDPLQVYPMRASFGQVKLGIDATPVTITLKDYGAQPIEIASLTLGGTNPGDFALRSETCTAAPVQVLKTCTISLGFKPTVVAARNATLTITGPSPVGTRRVTLTGTGTDPITVAPKSIDFGEETVGATPIVRPLTLSNAGGVTAGVSSITFSGVAGADYTVGSNGCAVIAPSSSCAVNVTFKASTVGVRGATMTITGPPPIGTRLIGLTGTGVRPSSVTAWGTVYRAGPAYTGNVGSALGRTVDGSTARLHLAYVTDRVGGAWAANSGPYLGAYYTRATTGSTWSAPKRLNPPNQHAYGVALAAASNRIYATWTTRASVTGTSATAPRVLYVRVNTNHGSSTAWKSAIRLTSTTGRVDIPTVAASGADAHIVWTNGVTGDIRIASSRDSGATWNQSTVGHTSFEVGPGYTGEPAVSVTGPIVAVTWRTGADESVYLRVSTDHGATWGPVEIVGTGSLGFASVAARDKRIAVAWTTGDDVLMRLRYNGTWGPIRTVAHLATGAASFPYAPAMVLQDPARIGVSWAEASSTSSASNLRWAESADNGKLFFQAQTLASTSTTRVRNDWASVVWPTAASRVVVWNGWTPDSRDYRLYVRTGTGTPVAPVLTGPNAGSAGARNPTSADLPPPIGAADAPLFVHRDRTTWDP